MKPVLGTSTVFLELFVITRGKWLSRGGDVTPLSSATAEGEVPLQYYTAR